MPNNEVMSPITQDIGNKIDKPELQKMYATLFKNASSMDASRFVHPCFADLLSRLSTDEIRLLKSLIHPVLLLKKSFRLTNLGVNFKRSVFRSGDNLRLLES